MNLQTDLQQAASHRTASSPCADCVPVQNKTGNTPIQTSDPRSIPTFERVLIATDFSPASQAAFRTALATCLELHASLLILHVFEYANIAPPQTGGQMIELQALSDQCRNSLESLRQQAVDAGVTCETALQSGIAESTILDVIVAMHIDLAILGTSALHGFERLVFGSTAESVLRKARCPVLTVGPQVAHPVGAFSIPQGPIIFATDFHGITIGAIRYAAQISHLTASPLHCLHVLPRTLEVGGESQVVQGIMSEALMQIAGESGVASIRQSAPLPTAARYPTPWSTTPSSRRPG